MFFVLSKLLYFLLKVTNWILFCLIGYLFIRKQSIKNIFKIAAVVLFFVFGNNFIYTKCMLAWCPKPHLTAYNRSYSTGILLCGITFADKYHQRYLGSTADRFVQASKLYHTGTVRKILVSGGSGSLFPKGEKEAVFLKKQLMAQGIPDTAIFIEQNSRNTFESALAAKNILDSAQLNPPYLLVTSAIHMPRSMAAFAGAGVKVLPHPADFDVVESQYSWADYIVPNFSTIVRWQYLLKEIVGLQVYKMSGKANRNM